MKTTHVIILTIKLLSLFTVVDVALAQGTTFTYQGQLQNNGNLANGKYDFTFALFNNNSTNTGQVGNALTNLDVGVTNGLFAVTLDFGAVFTGNVTWLSIGVRSNSGSSFTELNPLQELTPTPYAITATSASNLLGTLSVSQLSGTLALSQMPSGVVSNNASGVTLSGTFSGDGSGLANTVTTANYVFAYDTANHSISMANSFQNVSFTATSLSGWTYIGGPGATFICPQSGTYLVQYTAEAETTVNSSTTISLRAFNLGVNSEVFGSEASAILSVANQPVPISKSFLAYFSLGNDVDIQFAASNTDAELIAGVGAATNQPSVSCTIIRIQ